MYDGSPHTASINVYRANVNSTDLPQGYSLEHAYSSASVTHVSEGEKVANCDDLVIVNASNVDVTSRLNITRYNATIKIKPAPLNITTPSDSKTYDGTPLTADGECSGFVDGETATFTTTGEQTNVGSSDNSYLLD